MRKSLFFCLIFLSLPFSYACPEVIHLKNGQTVEGRIIERTAAYVKIEFMGVPLTYFSEDIEDIEEGSLPVSTDTYQPSTAAYTPGSGASAPKEPKELFRTVSPAVVFITTQTGLDTGGALGSGFIVNKDGIIVTNYHVVQSAQEINVRLKDGSIYPVKDIIYYDVERDICILKIDAHDLAVLALGDSNSLPIGEKVYCIGNPQGLEYTFSDGMLSGVRDYQDLKWLQFTAPVSPGSSGGPLISARAEVLGIVTMQSQSGQNLNFALAINMVKPFITANPQMTFKEFVAKVSKVDYYMAQGYNYGLQGYYKEAIAQYEKALKIKPELYLALDYIGDCYVSMGDYNTAISYYENALQIEPNFAPCHNSLGYAYAFQGKYKQAITCYEEALKIDPNFPSPYNNIGHAYNAISQYQKAIPFFEKAIQLDPYTPVFYENLGFAYQNLAQSNQARDYYLKAKELYLRMGDYQSAELTQSLINQLSYY